MGSPNFMTGLDNPSFAFNSRFFDDCRDNSGDCERTDLVHDEAHEAARCFVDDLNDQLAFASARIESGYHDGFQIILEKDGSYEGMINDCLSDLKESLLNNGYFEIYNGEGYTIDLMQDPKGVMQSYFAKKLESLWCSQRKIFTNETLAKHCIESIIDADELKGNRLLKKFAKEHGFGKIVGYGYTSSVDYTWH